MAFFTIKPRAFPEDLDETVAYLGLEKVDEETYRLPNGNTLKVHDADDPKRWALTPPQQ